MSAGTPSAGRLLAMAVEVSHVAGRLLVEGRPDDLGVTATKTSPSDVVTEMDTRAERLVVEHLLSARPHDGVLGEEGDDVAGTSGVRWVVDPVDGTVNYLYGSPAWAVSIAAEVDGEVVAGVVHVPSLGHTYSATHGGGAHRDGRRLTVRPAPALEIALVATGFAYTAALRARQAQVLAGVVPRVRDVRRTGSAAIDLCTVAAGQVDGYYERGAQLWDVAAGALVAREAGARVGGLRGAVASPALVLAAPPGLYEALDELLSALGADEEG